MGQLASTVFGRRRAAGQSRASARLERDARGRVCDRTHACLARLSFVSERRIGQTAFIVHVFDKDRDPSVDLTQPHAYQPTVGVDFQLYRANELDTSATRERMHVWDVGDAFNVARVRQLGLAVACYNVADRGSLERLTVQLERVRKGQPDQAIVLLGLRCDEAGRDGDGDGGGRVTLDDACAFAERHQVRCFGTDYAALPIAHDDWAGGRVPGARRADAEIAAARAACPYDARIDWRAAFQRRRTWWRSVDDGCGCGNGSGRVVCAPVIEVSTRELTREQGAWLRELLHELAVEVGLMHQPGRLLAAPK